MEYDTAFTRKASSKGEDDGEARTAPAGNAEYLVEDSFFSCCTCGSMNFEALFCISIVRDIC